MLKRFAAFFMALIVVASVNDVAFRVSAVQNSSLRQSTGNNGLASFNGDPFNWL